MSSRARAATRAATPYSQLATESSAGSTRLPRQHQEHRLRGIFRVVTIAQDPPADVQHHPPVPFHQHGKRRLRLLGRPVSEPFQQRTVRETRRRATPEQNGDLLHDSRRGFACQDPASPSGRRACLATRVVSAKDPDRPNFFHSPRKPDTDFIELLSAIDAQASCSERLPSIPPFTAPAAEKPRPPSARTPSDHQSTPRPARGRAIKNRVFFPMRREMPGNLLDDDLQERVLEGGPARS